MNRRDFLARCVGAAGGAVMAACAQTRAATVLFNNSVDLNIGAKRPNIVFIFIDDMGWTGTSYMGSEYYETPRIDKLSREGMVFTNAYTANNPEVADLDGDNKVDYEDLALFAADFGRADCP